MDDTCFLFRTVLKCTRKRTDDDVHRNKNSDVQRKDEIFVVQTFGQ